MYKAFQTGIVRLSAWIKTAKSADERQVLWCLARLPDAYREFTRTYESRYAEDIARHQQAALTRLAGETGSAGGLLADKLRRKLQSLNERFGLPALAMPHQVRLPKPSCIRKGKAPVASA